MRGVCQRLSPEQFPHIINHAKDGLVLINTGFLPVLEGIWDRVDPGEKFALMHDTPKESVTSLPLAGEYEALPSHATSDSLGLK